MLARQINLHHTSLLKIKHAYCETIKKSLKQQQTLSLSLSFVTSYSKNQSDGMYYDEVIILLSVQVSVVFKFDNAFWFLFHV
jgi:hypothetical protein